jgi:hypothetical protein
MWEWNEFDLTQISWVFSHSRILGTCAYSFFPIFISNATPTFNR